MTRSLTATTLPSEARGNVNTRRRPGTPSGASAAPLPGLRKARRKFLFAFPDGFRDETYLAFERHYKWNAHSRWQEKLAAPLYSGLLKKGAYREIAKTALAIELRTNLLFSFEKMAVRDAVASDRGARAFAEVFMLFSTERALLKNASMPGSKIVGNLPRRRTRVLTWPVATVFGFLADPRTHFFFKPTVTRGAARRLGMNLPYVSRPSWPVYKALLLFLVKLRAGLHDMRPRDMIDLQSFLWVQGSDEYPD